MSLAKITLIGCYNYDKTVLDGLFFENVDNETLKNILLMQCGEFELLYPDFNFMKNSIKVFSEKWKWCVAKWVRAINIEYNPIENYDRFESYGGEENVVNSAIMNNAQKATSNFNRGGSDVNNSEAKTSSYNSNVYQPDNTNRTTNTYGLNESNNNESFNNNKTETIEKRTPKLENHIHGNIGVTTNQQMLKSEFDIALWNLYENICELFKSEFCIMTY